MGHVDFDLLQMAFRYIYRVHGALRASLVAIAELFIGTGPFTTAVVQRVQLDAIGVLAMERPRAPYAIHGGGEQ